MTVREKKCIKCGETKPTINFKRRLTLAQSRAVLRNPDITTRYTADSKRCKACQQLLKRTKPLTAKDIRSKISSGDIHPIKGELKLQQIKEAIPHTRSRVMKEHWENIKRTLPYKTLKLKLADQVNRYGNRHFASKNLEDATQEQNSWNYIEAKRIRKDLLEQARNGVEIPSTIQIASLIKPKGEAQ